MKKILLALWLGLVISMFFISCESEIGEQEGVVFPQIQKENLFGKWVSDSFTIIFKETGQGESDMMPFFNWYLSNNNELALSYNNSFVTYIITELTHSTLKMYNLGNEDEVYSFVKYLDKERLYGMWQLDSLVYIYNENGRGDIVSVNFWNSDNINNKKSFLWKIEGYNLQLFTEEDGVKQYMIEALEDSLLIYSDVDSPNTKYELVRFEYKFQLDLTCLYGKWRSGMEYYVYNSDGTGHCWDEGDDVFEDEAQEFTWTVDESEMIHIHKMEMGGYVPMYYIITELTPQTLKYYDAYNHRDCYSFIKVY